MNKVFTIITAWLLLALPLISWGAEPVGVSPDAGIIVQSSATVDGEEIRLGDVARIEAHGLARQMVADISLGRSPKPGKVKVLNRRQFLSSLRFHQDLIDGLGIEIPDRVFVKRNSQTVCEATLRTFLEDCMGRRFNGKAVSLERIDIPESGQYPVGEVTLAPADSPRISRDGRFTLGIEVFVDGHKEARLRLAGRVAVYETLVVAAHDLSRDLCLSSGDGICVRQNIFTLDGEGIAGQADLAGKRLTRDVQKGEAILSQWLKPVPLVHKGDVVTLIAQKDSILIQTSGVSREDGFKDSLIEVENIRSGKVVRGLVRKPSTVEVVY